ncbi:response regulator [Christiangramia aquimixticola]|uniref:response regulator n=1 Tax=Christiangramia aquimixticola TaxID=1697558 RepID=UPI003AA902C3
MKKQTSIYKDTRVYESAEELYHEAPCGYISFTSNGTIYNVNKTLLGWLGYKSEEVLDKIKIQDLFKMGGKIFFETHFFPLIRIQGFANEINFEIKKKDNTTFPALINVKEIKGLTVNENRYRATIFDITDRKKYEQELLNSKIKAEQSSQAKAEFLATISHEIRTPLNAILGLGNLLAKTNLNVKQKEYSDILRLSSENLLNLINNLLDLSKMEAQQVRLEKKPFALRRLIESLVHTFDAKANEKKIQLYSEVDDNIPGYIHGDPIKLTQILTNLLGNAIKFTCEGFVKIKTDLKAKTENKIQLHFVVEDSGVGIPKDKLETIFKEFSQANYEVSLEYGGTGLGLSISQKLLQLHNSKMEVASEIGKGSSFSFDIEYEVFENSIPQPKEIYERVDPDLLGAVKVLVVEDNPVNIFVISEYLKDWNLEFQSAENGQEAIEAVKNDKFDVILMDLHMPVINGFEAASTIRNLNLDYQPAILALSATSRENIQKELKRAGIDDFISKPFGPNDLYKVLSHYIKKIPGLAESVIIENEDVTYSEEYENENTGKETFNLARFIKMANNKPEFLKKFIINTAKSFEDYLGDFEKALAKEDPVLISELIHKSTMSVYYIQADRLTELLRKCELGLEKKENHNIDIEKTVKKSRKEFHKIINGLKEVDVDVLIE